MSEKESLAPERELGRRRYTVTITEYAECVVHVQDYRKIGVQENGRDELGYKTMAVHQKKEREIFRGDFATRPKGSEIAKLMEGEQP